MKRCLSLIALSLLILPQTTLASDLSPLRGLFGNKQEAAGPCLLAQYKVPSLSYEELRKAGAELKLNQQYCEANAYFKRMIAEALTPDQTAAARFELIESSFFQRDYDQVFSQATSFLQHFERSALAERVYYLAVKSVDENIELTNGKDSRWIQIGLDDGVKDPLTQVNREKQEALNIPIFSFKAFLDLYPNSPYAVHVREMLEKTRGAISGKLIAEARQLAMRWDFAPAIGKLKVILAQGPGNASFPEALFEAINFTYGFAYRVKNENQIPANKLAKWLIIDEKDVTTELRAKLAIELEAQAKSLKKMMHEKLPNNPWTRRLM